ncbi:helix-turn-helix domain-containing protein [Desulfovibrio litoralis]|uniref:DNA binding domain-containing protein, excisionase family n=1 Tax=Desulfovibrio litoralis DSM 11393 TaxID=1121455 RepID=A0A1M7SCI8_9BACT|nr:helix-turn-helix domain-containing protein [Desulfovibrio litoralis]SHN56190.1 DNA binding domain-containing protein, excisionase family [Desulfovibrio litoralis DSM 11393]
MKKTTYTLSEAATLLSCHKETLRRAIKEGSLRAARLGRGWRISKVDLTAFWNEQGGGELFPKEESNSESNQDKKDMLDSVKNKEKQNKAAKANEPMQLTLPTS